MLGVASAALAHHSFVAKYDPSKPVTLKGTVTKLEWTNPYARFYIDVKGTDGAAVSWELELGSPNTLIRYAWKRDSMKVGDEVTVEGFRAKDGSKLANAKTVKFADGRVVQRRLFARGSQFHDIVLAAPAAALHHGKAGDLLTHCQTVLDAAFPVRSERFCEQTTKAAPVAHGRLDQPSPSEDEAPKLSRRVSHSC